MTSILALALSAFAALSPIKVHVDGDGYMRFVRDGRVVYAKQATLGNVNGALGADGAKLLPEIDIPDSATSISIDLMGNIDAGSAHLGRLVLGVFPAGSTSSGLGSFVTFSDRAALINPGEETAGVIRIDGASSIATAITDPKPNVVQATKISVRKINLSIAGTGYFEITGPNGRDCFTRNGSLKLSSNGQIETLNGFLLKPNIVIPTGATDVSVSAIGSVTAICPGASEAVTLGQITIATFDNPSALTALDTDLFIGGPNSGPVTTNAPGENGAGLIKFNGSLHGDTSAIIAKHSTPATTKAATHSQSPVKSNPSSGAQIEILVRQHTDVVGKNFSLGDIATITGPEELATAYKKVSIGATAIAGTNRVIDQHYLVLKLMGAGFHAGSYVLVVPDGADVARKTATIAADDIVAAALKAVQDKTGMKVQFRSTEPIQPIVADDGNLTIESSDPVLSNKNYRVLITARLGTSIVATRTVVLAPPADLGSIKMGDAVTVILKAGSAIIEVQGKALGPGFVGQRIQVSIVGVGSKPTTQTGTVIDSGKVEVDL